MVRKEKNRNGGGGGKKGFAGLKSGGGGGGKKFIAVQKLPPLTEEEAKKLPQAQKRKRKFWPPILLIFFLLLDVASAIVLFGEAKNWTYNSQWFDMGSWKQEVLDIAILALLRLFVIPAFILLIIRFGDPDKREISKCDASDSPSITEKRQRKGLSIQGSTGGSFYVRLSNTTTEEDLIQNFEKNRRRAKFWKRILLAMMLVFTTACQAYVGVKCVTINYLQSGLQVGFAAAMIVCINMEFSMASKFASDMIVDTKFFVAPSLHNHPLYRKKIALVLCDVCRRRILDDYRYTCQWCNYDICEVCWRTKNRQAARQDNVIGKDNGMGTRGELSPQSYIGRYISLLKPHKWWVFTGVFSLLLSSATDIFMPKIQGNIIDHIIFANRKDFNENILIYAGLSLGNGLFGAVRNLCFAVMARYVAVDLRDLMFTAVTVQDIEFHDRMSSGELASRMGSDIGAMTQPMRTATKTLISNTVTLAGGVAMCFITSWRLSFLAFTTVAPVMYITREYAVWSREIFRLMWAAYGESMSVATQTWQNIRTVRAFNKENYEIKRFKAHTKKALRNGLKDASADTIRYILTNYLDLGAGVLILWWGGTKIFDESESQLGNAGTSKLTVGMLFTFQLYWNQINNSWQKLQNILSSFTRATGAADRVLSLLDTLPNITPEGDETPPGGDIQLKNLRFTYQMRPEQEILKGVNLTIPARKVTAIVGPSGGGKTTIINLLLRFYDPSKGQLLFDGMDLRDKNIEIVRNYIGLVSQDTQLFSTSIEDNIAYGAVNGYSTEDLHQAANAANAHEFIMDFDDKYDTLCGERGILLSGGQKQRIAIARMLMKKPKLLLLDEATSSLDTVSEALVQQALDKIIWESGSTVVLVAHRLSTVINADKIAVLDGGVIVEEGTHAELVAINGKYAQLVSRQTKMDKNRLNADQPSATLDDLFAESASSPNIELESKGR